MVIRFTVLPIMLRTITNASSIVSVSPLSHHHSVHSEVLFSVTAELIESVDMIIHNICMYIVKTSKYYEVLFSFDICYAKSCQHHLVTYFIDRSHCSNRSYSSCRFHQLALKFRLFIFNPSDFLYFHNFLLNKIHSSVTVNFNTTVTILFLFICDRWRLSCKNQINNKLSKPYTFLYDAPISYSINWYILLIGCVRKFKSPSEHFYNNPFYFLTSF